MSSRAGQTPSLTKLCRDLHHRLCPPLAKPLPWGPMLRVKGDHGDTELTRACTMEGESIGANGTTGIHPSTSTA